jgi:hypothetical protein
VGGILPSVGCQVEYAGMTLPSGKYMHDDVQYFPRGPEFPWANTQAATQRARMRAMGIEPPADLGVVAPVAPPGGIPPVQNQFGRPQDINMSPLDVVPQPGNVPAPPAPGIPGGPEVNAPGAAAPAAPAPGAAAPGAPRPTPPPPPPPPGGNAAAEPNP